MCSVGMSARHDVSPRVGAVLLLAVLVAHLAFMVSPLHSLMLIGGVHAAPMASKAADEQAATLIEPDPTHQHASHCRIEWTNAAQGSVLAAFLAVSLASAFLALDGHVSGLRPIARALGPPMVGDAQALLQVFRL
jgi:hypothetical protein